MPTNLRIEEDAVLEKFIARYRSAVTAVVSGFDRLVFRGTLLPLVMERGMHTLLSRTGVRLLNFKRYALTTSERVTNASLREAVEGQRTGALSPVGEDRQGGPRPPTAARASGGGGLIVRCASSNPA